MALARRPWLLAGLVLLAARDASAQGWVQTYGLDPGTAYDGAAAPDGGYVIVGSILSPSAPGGSAANDAFLMKLSASGVVEWTVAFGGPGSDDFSGVAALSDGYLVVGETRGSATYELLAVRFDLAGDVVWQRTYGPFFGQERHRLRPSVDGNFYTSGTSYVDAVFRRSVVKLGTDGSVAWHRGIISGYINSSDKGTEILETPSGGVILDTLRYEDHDRPILVALDADGDLLWKHEYGASTDTYFLGGMARKADGSILVSGSVMAVANWATLDEFVFQIDADGRLAWHDRFGHPAAAEWGFEPTVTPDGDFLMSGGGTGFGSEQTVSRLDATGPIISTMEASSTPHLRKVVVPAGILGIGIGWSFDTIDVGLLDFDMQSTAPCVSTSDVPLESLPITPGEADVDLTIETLTTIPVDTTFATTRITMIGTCAGASCVPLSCGILQASPTDACPGERVILSLATTGGDGAITVRWDLDGDTATDDATGSPIAASMRASPWNVTARATDSCVLGAHSCSQSRTLTSPSRPGEVSDVRAGGPPLLVPSPTEVVVEKLAGASAYDLYVGPIGSWYFCDAATGRRCAETAWLDRGDGTVSLANPFPPSGSSWILVTAANHCFEGSAGSDSFGAAHASDASWQACGPAP